MTWQPFDEDGWSVDDNYSTPGTMPDRRIVWGCEAPELVITESLAFHDRRVADTGVGQERHPSENQDDDMTNDLTDIGVDVDDDLDQVKIPQGSLFLEFYAAGASSRNNGFGPQNCTTCQLANWI